MCTGSGACTHLPLCASLHGNRAIASGSSAMVRQLPGAVVPVISHTRLMRAVMGRSRSSSVSAARRSAAPGRPVTDRQMRDGILVGAAIGKVAGKGSRHRAGQDPEPPGRPRCEPQDILPEPPGGRETAVESSHRRRRCRQGRRGGSRDRQRRRERVQDRHMRGNTPRCGAVQPGAMAADSASGTGTRTALCAAIGAGITGSMGPSSPGRRHPPASRADPPRRTARCAQTEIRGDSGLAHTNVCHADERAFITKRRRNHSEATC